MLVQHVFCTALLLVLRIHTIKINMKKVNSRKCFLQRQGYKKYNQKPQHVEYYDRK